MNKLIHLIYCINIYIINLILRYNYLKNIRLYGYLIIPFIQFTQFLLLVTNSETRQEIFFFYP